jgi:hypothetical protein
MACRFSGTGKYTRVGIISGKNQQLLKKYFTAPKTHQGHAGSVL